MNFNGHLRKFVRSEDDMEDLRGERKYQNTHTDELKRIVRKYADTVGRGTKVSDFELRQWLEVTEELQMRTEQ